MSSRPGALPFFSNLMPMSSSSAVNALVNPGSSGYRCRSRRTFGCLFGALPLSRSWCATWFAVVLQCCFGLHGSSQSLRIVDHAFKVHYRFCEITDPVNKDCGGGIGSIYTVCQLTEVCVCE